MISTLVPAALNRLWVMDQEEDDDFTPWTSHGRARLRLAADGLVEAIRTHASSIRDIRNDDGAAEIMAAGNQLVPALLAYADAQFDYTGTAFPLGTLYELADDDDDEEDADPGPVGGVSILRRTDFMVTDEDSVLKAGRKAYRRSTGKAKKKSAAAHVTHLGEALYQIAHADGWDSLIRVQGLQPIGGIVLVQSSEELLGSDPDEWPADDLFDHDEDRLLFRQDDIFGN